MNRAGDESRWLRFNLTPAEAFDFAARLARVADAAELYNEQWQKRGGGK